MTIYNRVLKFKKRYPGTLVFRLKKHAKVVENVLDKDEQVLYAFCGQRNDQMSMFFDSSVIALTNKRLIIGQKRLFWGYFVITVTPELFNDLKIRSGLFFGSVEIDTVKENIFISNLDKKSLDEIETMVNKIMLDNKRRLKSLSK